MLYNSLATQGAPNKPPSPRASSPKCSLCEMKRGEDGAAVKVHRRRGRNELWAPQEVTMGEVSAAASVGASALRTEVSTGHPHRHSDQKKDKLLIKR